MKKLKSLKVAKLKDDGVGVHDRVDVEGGSLSSALLKFYVPELHNTRNSSLKQMCTLTESAISLNVLKIFFNSFTDKSKSKFQSGS